MHSKSTTIRAALLPLLLLSNLLLLSGCFEAELTDSQYLERARSAQDRGDIAAAIIDLKNALKANGANREARWLLGNLYLTRGDGEAAAKELERAGSLGVEEAALVLPLARAAAMQKDFKRVLLVADPRAAVDDQIRVKIYTVRGHALEELGNFDTAREAFENALKLDPEHAPAKLGLARLALAQKDYDQADQLLEQIRGEHRDDPQAWYLEGQKELEHRAFKAAEKAFVNALRLRSSYAEARFGLAISLLNQGKTEMASEVIRGIPETQRDGPRGQFLQAQIAFLDKRYEDAARFLNEVLNSNPHHLRSQALMAATQSALGNTELAESYARKVLAKRPNWIAGKKILASILIARGENALAAEVLQGESGAEMSDPQLLAMISTALLQTGDLSAAREALEQSSTQSTESATLSKQALELLEKDKIDEAVAALKPATEFEAPENRDRLELYFERSNKGDVAGAMAVADKMAADFPQSSIPPNLRGLLLVRMRRIDEARAAFQQALEISPNSRSAVLNLANLDRLVGKVEAARQRLLEFIENNPDYAPALLELAILELRDGNREQALDWARKALALEPDMLEARMLLVKDLANKGQDKQVVALLDAIPRELRNNPETLLVKAKAQLQIKQPGEAEKTLRHLLQLRPDSSTGYYLLAEALAAQGQFPEAIKELQALVALHPYAMASRLTLARLLIQRQRTDEAKEHVALLSQYFPDRPEVLALQNSLRSPGTAPRVAGETAADDEWFASQQDLLTISRARWLAGQRDQALNGMETWLQTHPDDIRVRRVLVTNYIDAGQLTRTINHLELILEDDPEDTLSLNNLAWALAEQAPERALSLARRAHELDADNPFIKDTLAELLLNTGDRQQALRLLHEASGAMPDNDGIRLNLARALIADGDTAGARQQLKAIASKTADSVERRAAAALLQGMTDQSLEN